MVISHDPGFLNVVCTDIIQYSGQKTLDYYEGNFDAFRKARSAMCQAIEHSPLGPWENTVQTPYRRMFSGPGECWTGVLHVGRDRFVCDILD